MKRSQARVSLPKDLYFHPTFGEAEVEAVSEVIRSGRTTQFSSSKIEEFEKAFAEYVGAKEAVAVNSGTAALHTLLAACGVGPGDEVIVPAFTFIGTVGPVLQQGARPVFADIDPASFCMTAADAAKKITPRTKAIMPVDIFGHPADLDPLRELAKKHDIYFLEDGCQAHGSEYKGMKVGGLADATCYSFQESKSLATAEGGMITTNDPKLAALCREVRHQGETEWGQIDRLGYNYRMTALQAALGIVQLGKLDQAIQQRRKIAGIYEKALGDLKGLALPKEKPYAKSIFHVYSMLLPNELSPKRDAIVQALRRELVPAGIYYPNPLYTSPLFKDDPGPFNCPTTEDVTSRIFGLQTYQSMPLDIAEKIGIITRDILAQYL
ncbi:MAG: DegT/DnrJ/EryC1/StrS family aminotransferase [Firmicutes bacterium]|nr:DegT/DnrJ/EryC1/StrS family aminotransferase [Bacillota bacterium]